MSRNISRKLNEAVAKNGGSWVCHYCGYKIVPQQIGDLSNDAVIVSSVEDVVILDGMIVTARKPGLLQKVIGDKVYYYSISDKYRWAEVDHVIPTSRGGDDSIANLVPACKKCNAQKGAMTETEYLNWLVKNASV